MEVKREQRCAQRGPQQTEEQENTLVTPSFMSVDKQEPELDVNHQEESAIEGRVEDCEAQLH